MIFDRVCDLPPPQRDQMLDELAENDEQLKETIAGMLERDTESDPFFDENQRVPSTSTFGLIKPGDVVDAYEIVELLGEGGMGAVYLARQHKPVRRDVALKIVGSGLDSVGVISRFEAERQVLALFDHPNLTRIFDGGITEFGLPYFVMEHVPGASITNYCRSNSVDLKGRLEMFVDICDAIQHAHEKGVIHRDIKPSNILVTSSDKCPRPKVIDFGIAKSIDRQTNTARLTIAGDVFGTPLYMSPEQAENGSIAVDVRSDIYSLGVVLYELLTGATPLRESDVDGSNCLRTLEAIRDHKIELPSIKVASSEELSKKRGYGPNGKSLSRKIRGDLDRVVAKSLAKDRKLRYETVADFRKDVTNFLEGNPVLAIAPSFSYRFKKFVQKHPWPSGITALLSAGILVSAFFAINQAIQNSIALSKNRILVNQLKEQRKCLGDALERAESAEVEQGKILRLKKYEVAVERAMTEFESDLETEYRDAMGQAEVQWAGFENNGFSMTFDLGQMADPAVRSQKKLMQPLNEALQNQLELASESGEMQTISGGPGFPFEISLMSTGSSGLEMESESEAIGDEWPCDDAKTNETAGADGRAANAYDPFLYEMLMGRMPLPGMVSPFGMMPPSMTNSNGMFGNLNEGDGSVMEDFHLPNSSGTTSKLELAASMEMLGLVCLTPAARMNESSLPIVQKFPSWGPYPDADKERVRMLKSTLKFCEYLLVELDQEFQPFDAFVGVTHDAIAQLNLELGMFDVAQVAAERALVIHQSANVKSLQLFSMILIQHAKNGLGEDVSADEVEKTIQTQIDELASLDGPSNALHAKQLNYLLHQR